MGASIQQNERLDLQTLYPPLDQYTVICQTENYAVWRHLLRDQGLIEFNIQAKDYFEFREHIEGFFFRHRHHLLVSSQHMSISEKQSSGKVYYERILTNLSKIKDTPFGDVLLIIYTALKGFEILYHKFGFFLIKEEMFHITNNKTLKVWHCKDIQRLKPEPARAPINPEQGMVQSILDIIVRHSNSLNNYLPIGQILLKNSTSFKSTLSKFQSICHQRGFTLPHRLACLDEIPPEVISFLDEYGKRANQKGFEKQIQTPTRSNLKLNSSQPKKRGRGITLSKSKDKKQQSCNLTKTMDLSRPKSSQGCRSTINFTQQNPTAPIRKISHNLHPVQTTFIPVRAHPLQNIQMTPFSEFAQPLQIHRHPGTLCVNRANFQRNNQLPFYSRVYITNFPPTAHHQNFSGQESLTKGVTSRAPYKCQNVQPKQFEENRDNEMSFKNYLTNYQLTPKTSKMCNEIKEDQQYFIEISDKKPSQTMKQTFVDVLKTLTLSQKKFQSQQVGFKARFEEYKKNFSHNVQKNKENNRSFQVEQMHSESLYSRTLGRNNSSSSSSSSFFPGLLNAATIKSYAISEQSMSDSIISEKNPINSSKLFQKKSTGQLLSLDTLNYSNQSRKQQMQASALQSAVFVYGTPKSLWKMKNF